MTSLFKFVELRLHKLTMLPPAVRAVCWMVLGTLSFAIMIALVRKTGETFSAFEIAFWRALFGLALMAPWLFRVRLSGLRTRRVGMHTMRNSLHFFGVVLWYYAVTRINLSQGMALQFTVPLFTMALAVMFLKERVDAHRILAALVGFAGVLIILRPGVAAISPVATIILAASVFYAGSNLYTKLLGSTETPELVVFYMNLMHLPMAIAGAAFVGWTVPGWADIPWLFGVALSATLAHLCLAHALRLTEAGKVMPLDFLKLPWVTLLAYLAFGERPDSWAWIGGAVIFAATYYIVRRDTKAAPA